MCLYTQDADKVKTDAPVGFVYFCRTGCFAVWRAQRWGKAPGTEGGEDMVRTGQEELCKALEAAKPSAHGCDLGNASRT